MTLPAAPRPDREGWRPRLVALDLDGTVVDYGNEHTPPSARVREAVAGLLETGIAVTVATGRAVWSALPSVHDLGLHGVTLLASNGAVLYDSDSGTVLQAVTHDPGPAARALAAADPRLTFAVEHGTQGWRTTPEFARDFDSHFLDALPLAELVVAPTTRMVARLPGAEDVADLWARSSQEAQTLAERVLDPAAYSHEIGYTGWIDVAAAGVNKATGAAGLAARLGIAAADVLALGDGTNDLALFAWAGRSVAMGQATARVRAAADEVTAPVTEDGVALVLERYLR